jgi:hypothetical protein
MLNPKFQAVEWNRARNAIFAGTVFFGLVMIMDLSWKSTQSFAELILHPGFAPFFWYLGGIQELGPLLLIGFLIDILVYASGFYILQSLKQYIAWQRTRSRP